MHRLAAGAEINLSEIVSALVSAFVPESLHRRVGKGGYLSALQTLDRRLTGAQWALIHRLEGRLLKA